MRSILVLGAGRIGSVIARLLAGCGDYGVQVADCDEAALGRLPRGDALAPLALDSKDAAALAGALDGKFAVLNALPWSVTAQVGEAARAAGVHYLDLTEDLAATRTIEGLAADAPCAFVPQCGLAPGFVGIVAQHLAAGFDEVRDMHLHVGALPRYATGALQYNLTWSTDGLINEYCNPCDAIVGGRLCQVPALEGLCRLRLDGTEYEAFNTSGGLGSLAQMWEGRVQNLSYRTVRYPGHRDLMRTLLHDLHLADDRATLKRILERALPHAAQDRVVIFVSLAGMQGGRLEQLSHSSCLYGADVGGYAATAIQLATSASICAVLDLLAAGALPQSGLVRQEAIAHQDFTENRFGKYYLGQQMGDQ